MFYIYGIGLLTHLFSHAVSGLISAVRASIISTRGYPRKAGDAPG
jgi:hypothetical protein